MDGMPLSWNSGQLSPSDIEVRLVLLKSSEVPSDWELNMFYCNVMTESNLGARLQHLDVIKIHELAT